MARNRMPSETITSCDLAVDDDPAPADERPKSGVDGAEGWPRACDGAKTMILAKRLGLALLALGLVIGATRPATAGHMLHGYVDGLGVSNASNRSGDSDRDVQSYHQESQYNALGSVDTSAAVPGANATADSRALAGYEGAGQGMEPHRLLQVFASSISTNTNGVMAGSEGLASAQASWRDEFTISSVNSSELLTLRFEAFFHAAVHLAGGGDTTSPADFAIGASLQGKNADYGGNTYGEVYHRGWDSIELGGIHDNSGHKFTGQLIWEGTFRPFDGSVSGGFSIGFGALARSGNNSSAIVNGLSTAGLGSVLVVNQDGTTATPESLGMTLSFHSGMSSPNMTAVPEPASIIHASIAGLAGIGYAWRCLGGKTGT